MEIQDFILKLTEQFEETDISLIKPNTEFKKLNEWSSMLSLSVIAMIDDEYGVTIKGNDLRESKTIEDLFNKIIQYKKK